MDTLFFKTSIAFYSLPKPGRKKHTKYQRQKEKHQKKTL